jgi:hypothetical protein
MLSSPGGATDHSRRPLVDGGGCDVIFFVILVVVILMLVMLKVAAVGV